MSSLLRRLQARLPIVVLVVGSAVVVKGADQIAMGDNAAQSSWQFSAGVKVRRFSGSFLGPKALDLRPFYQRRADFGRGDVGVPTGSDQRVVYEDGFVGPHDLGLNDGFASFGFESSDQFTASVLGGNFKSTPGTLTFHSSATLFSYDTRFDAQPINDSVVAAGPVLNLRHSLGSWGQSELGMSLTLSYMPVHLAPGMQFSGLQSVTENMRQKNYTYVFEHTMGPASVNPPGTYGAGAGLGVVINSELATNSNGISISRPYNGPKTSSSELSRDRVAATAVAMTRNKLDVEFYDFCWGVDWTFAPFQRFTVGLALGPTVNLVSYDFNARTDWYLNGRHIGTRPAEKSGNEVKLGGRAMLQATYDLNCKKTWFVTMAGGYDWVDTARLDARGDKAEFDPSSWSGQMAVGMRF